MIRSTAAMQPFDFPFFDSCGMIGGIAPSPLLLDTIIRRVDRIRHRGGDGFGIYFRLPEKYLEEDLSRTEYRNFTETSAVAEYRERKGVELNGRQPLILMMQLPEMAVGQGGLERIIEVLRSHLLECLTARPVSRSTADADPVILWRILVCDTADKPDPDLHHRMRVVIREIVASTHRWGVPNSFHPLSFSDRRMVLYKVMGDCHDFRRALLDEHITGVRTDLFLGHIRYSTNTYPLHRTAQPFEGLAHNGEINNIGSIRRAMESYGIPLSGALSDSADLAALVGQLTGVWGLDLSQALYLLFPRTWIPTPLSGEKYDISNSVSRLSLLRDFVTHAFSPFRAEGPAAVIATDGVELIGRLDNMGLRPLFLMERQDGAFFFTSEPGATGNPEEYRRIRILKPGEMIVVRPEGVNLRVVEPAATETTVLENLFPDADFLQNLAVATIKSRSVFRQSRVDDGKKMLIPLRLPVGGCEEHYRLINGYSFRARRQLESLFGQGKEIGSGTGWRGGLAANWKFIFRFADLFKAMTAQVTAPTISAEHEMSAMDSGTILGSRIHPWPAQNIGRRFQFFRLSMPLIPGCEELTQAGIEFFNRLGRELGVPTLNDLLKIDPASGLEISRVDCTIAPGDLSPVSGGFAGEKLKQILIGLLHEVEQMIRERMPPVILLRDSGAGREGKRVALPPELVVGALDHHLKKNQLRHLTRLVVQSEELNEPHSMFVLLQLGADALIPTLLCREMLQTGTAKREAIFDFMHHGFRALNRALAIQYGRIATNHYASGRGGRRICPMGLDHEICELLGLSPGIGEGVGWEKIVADLRQKERMLTEPLPPPVDPLQRQIDTMPLDRAMASYALLGGFDGGGIGSGKESAGRLKIAWQVLRDVPGRDRGPSHSPELLGKSGGGKNPPADWPARLSRLSIPDAARIMEDLYSESKRRPYTFLDSLQFKIDPSPGTAVGGFAGTDKYSGEPDQVESGVDGRKINQVIGAISYGANSRFVHELYAIVMAECGGMSNGGEGGVPENIRALYLTDRLRKEGGTAAELARRLPLELPLSCQGKSLPVLETLAGELLDRVPPDFAASRFEQISTGRFGVGAYAFLDTHFLEIKIGQGAKPGVGGSLPGAKVLPDIAATRGVNIGQTLNSPTVHHDIYSIEDLRQLITAAKTLGPEIKVSVKLAAMDDLDIVALGVVKAGADFIWVDGFEAGTGSAKDAHKEHCGLSAAPILNRIHKTLVAFGMRGAYHHQNTDDRISRREFHRLNKSEREQYHWKGPRLIGAGGVRNGDDALKLILSGADYIGYGDAAQNAVGCIRCNRCPTGSCPAAITTNDPARVGKFDSPTNARTLKRFIQILDYTVRRRALLLCSDIRNVEELVGCSNFLEQNQAAHFRIDSEFFRAPTEQTFLMDRIVDSQGDIRNVRERPATKHINRTFENWCTGLEEHYRHGDVTAIADHRRTGEHILPPEYFRLNIEFPVGNEDRLIGTTIVRRFIHLKNRVRLGGGPNISIHFKNHGAAGSGYGMFGVDGMDFTLVGTGGDYLGEAVNGARIFVLPAVNGRGELVAGSGGAGNTVAYAMRGGKLHLFSTPGTRFAIRFSGGKAFVWGDPDEVERSFHPDAVKPQFFAEYMTRGVIVFCPDPGFNLLCAATGKDTRLLCRKPQALSWEEYRTSLSARIPDSFEALPIEREDAILIERGRNEYEKRARENGIDLPVTPIRPGENLFETFVLIGERR